MVNHQQGTWNCPIAGCEAIATPFNLIRPSDLISEGLIRVKAEGGTVLRILVGDEEMKFTPEVKMER